MTFIESVVNHDKNEYVNKRHLLVCNRCCWCLSYLPDRENDTIEYFDNCPMCNEEINQCLSQRMPQKGSIQSIYRIQ